MAYPAKYFLPMFSAFVTLRYGGGIDSGDDWRQVVDPSRLLRAVQFSDSDTLTPWIRSRFGAFEWLASLARCRRNASELNRLK